MKLVRPVFFAIAVLSIATAGIALAAKRKPAPMRSADIAGTYELIDRVLVGGKVLKRPEIAALYTMANGRANLNLFVRNADSSIASESSIIRYTLNENTYCEWIEYTTRNNLDAPGLTNVAPSVASHCTPIKVTNDEVVFAAPGESVTTTYDRHGFSATIMGQFTDHWRKIG